MSNTELKQKYNDIKKKLHYCSPAEKKGLKTLWDYYYGLKVKRGLL